MPTIHVQWEEGHYSVVPEGYGDFSTEITEEELRWVEEACIMYSNLQKFLEEKERKAGPQKVRPFYHRCRDNPCERDNQNHCHFCGRDMSEEC